MICGREGGKEGQEEERRDDMRTTMSSWTGRISDTQERRRGGRCGWERQGADEGLRLTCCDAAAA